MSSKFLRPFPKQKVQNIKVVFAEYLWDDIISALNKAIEPIINPKVKQKWLTTTNKLLPKNNLGYASQDEYLKTTGLTKEKIIKNTIAYVFPDLADIDLKSLCEQFMIFTKKSQILIYHLEDQNLVIYKEIYDSLIYIKNIKNIIAKNNKVRSSSHLGIRHNTHWKALLKSEINALKYRLVHPYFPLTNKDEIEKTKLQIYFLEKAINKEYKILIDLFHFANIHFGLDYPLLHLSKEEQETISQLLTLLNGFRTSNEELIKSVMIYLRMQSKITTPGDYEKLSSSILHIAIHFFTKIYIEKAKKRKKRVNHFNYTKDDIDKRIRVKTFINDMPIYTFTQNNYFDFLNEFLNLFFKSFQGEKNIFEPNLTHENKASNFTILRNIVQIKQDYNLTKREIKSLLTLFEITGQDSEKISNLLVNS